MAPATRCVPRFSAAPAAPRCPERAVPTGVHPPGREPGSCSRCSADPAQGQRQRRQRPEDCIEGGPRRQHPLPPWRPEAVTTERPGLWVLKGPQAGPQLSVPVRTQDKVGTGGRHGAEASGKRPHSPVWGRPPVPGCHSWRAFEGTFHSGRAPSGGNLSRVTLGRAGPGARFPLPQPSASPAGSCPAALPCPPPALPLRRAPPSQHCCLVPGV